MPRIVVTGNAGSGKTTLSSFLGAHLRLPVISMEKIVWDPGWKVVPKEEVDRRLAPILSQENWVIDGVSSRVFETADIVIFLDLPIVTCLSRALKRSLFHLFRQRPDLPERCSEILIIRGMIRIILEFPRTTRPKILSLFDRYAGKKNMLRIESDEELGFLMKDIAQRGSSWLTYT